MDPLLSLAPRERAELVGEAAARRGLHPVLVEKDYWVCVLLDVLFDRQQPAGSLIFKGGTSLSKGYDLIQRFSEDVDVAFDKRQFGFEGDRDPEAAPSGAKAKDLIDALSAAVAAHVSGPFREMLAGRLAERLGDDGWSLEPAAVDKATLLFRYPASLARSAYGQAAYIGPVVRLETGARSDPWPAEERRVRSYAADAFPDVIPGEVRVNTLAPLRTFWEKATILHAEAHREQGGANRCSRHYYDLVQIARSPHGEVALADAQMRERVVAHKSLFFRSSWARYDTAKPGSFILVPGEARQKALAVDYGKMRPMFFEPPPRFEAVLDGLRELEARINTLG